MRAARVPEGDGARLSKGIWRQERGNLGALPSGPSDANARSDFTRVLEEGQLFERQKSTQKRKLGPSLVSFIFLFIFPATAFCWHDRLRESSTRCEG